jgi:hypothetical protein
VHLHSYDDEEELSTSTHSNAAVERSYHEYSAFVDDVREVYDNKGVEIDANGPDLLPIFHEVDLQLVRPREGGIAC